MAGWSCKDNEVIEWDGTIKAKTYKGDGSKLTGITGGGGGSTVWTSDAVYLWPSVPTQIVSGAGFITGGAVSGAYIYGDGSNLTGLPTGGNYDVTSQAVVTLSAAYYTHIPNYDITSAAQIQDAANIVVVSSALYTDIANMVVVSSALYTDIANLVVVSAARVQNTTDISVVSAAMVVSAAVWNNLNSITPLSAAYYTHAADASNPHGVALTQGYLSLASGAVTEDHVASAAVYIPNIIYNTTSAAITASNYPIGTLLVVYTA